jgi:flagellar basal-body rod modification protein FlgD
VTIDPTAGATTGTTDPTSGKPDPLGRDAFLNLLVTQLQNQNPLEPQPDGAFLAQLAQFSSLESLQQIQSDMSGLRGIFESAVTPTVPATDAAPTTDTTGGL